MIKIMNKRFKIVMLACYLVSMLMLVGRNMFADSLSDFTKGLLDGMMGVFALTLIVYFGYCLGKRQNPFRI